MESFLIRNIAENASEFYHFETPPRILEEILLYDDELAETSPRNRLQTRILIVSWIHGIRCQWNNL